MRRTCSQSKGLRTRNHPWVLPTKVPCGISLSSSLRKFSYKISLYKNNSYGISPRCIGKDGGCTEMNYLQSCVLSWFPRSCARSLGPHEVARFLRSLGSHEVSFSRNSVVTKLVSHKVPHKVGFLWSCAQRCWVLPEFRSHKVAGFSESWALTKLLGSHEVPLSQSSALKEFPTKFSKWHEGGLSMRKNFCCYSRALGIALIALRGLHNDAMTLTSPGRHKHHPRRASYCRSLAVCIRPSLSFLRCKDSSPKWSFPQETDVLTLDYRINSTSVSQQGCENESSSGDVKPRWMHANQSFASLLITPSLQSTVHLSIDIGKCRKQKSHVVWLVFHLKGIYKGLTVTLCLLLSVSCQSLQRWKTHKAWSDGSSARFLEMIQSAVVSLKRKCIINQVLQNGVETENNQSIAG